MASMIMASDVAYFDRMLNLIPSRFYLPPDPETINSQWKQKYLKNTKGNAPKQNLKESSRKGKRARFDIEQNKTTSEEQQAYAEKTALPQTPGPLTKQTGSSSARGGLDALRERLQLRIAKLKNDRHSNVSNSATIRKARRAAARTDSDSVAPRSATDGPDSLAAAEPEQPEKKKRRKLSASAGAGEQQKQNGDQEASPVESNRSSTLLFQKLSVGTDEEVAGKRGPSNRDLKSLLAKAEAQQQRAVELKKSDAGKQLLKQRAWSAAMTKVDGKHNRVRDDPKLIKKAMKRKAREKRRSAEQWAERKEAQQQDTAERQEKRNENLRNKRTRGRPEQKAPGDRQGAPPRPGGANEGKGNNNSNGRNASSRPGFEGKGRGGGKSSRAGFEGKGRGRGAASSKAGGFEGNKRPKRGGGGGAGRKGKGRKQK